MAPDPLAWLLAPDADPAIRWQALRDLTDASPAEIAAERARVPAGPTCAEILARQGADGSWHREGAREWMLNLFTLQLLRATGVDPAAPAVAAAVHRLASGFRWHESLGGKPFFDGETEPCINGGTLALGAYFGRPSPSLLRRLLGEQLADGGWNCEAPPSVRSSYHTTICVLEGLLEYERALASARSAPPRSEAAPANDDGGPALAEIASARHRAEEYLLQRGLFRRLSTGELAHPGFLQFAYPPRYHYDVLRALDYFRATGAAPDPRLRYALHLLESRRAPDGRWPLDASYAESIATPFNEAVGQPSRWNTLRALRVLRWAGGKALVLEPPL